MTFKREEIYNFSLSSKQLRPIRAKFSDDTTFYSLIIYIGSTDLIKHTVSKSLGQVRKKAIKKKKIIMKWYGQRKKKGDKVTTESKTWLFKWY